MSDQNLGDIFQERAAYTAIAQRCAQFAVQMLGEARDATELWQQSLPAISQATFRLTARLNASGPGTADALPAPWDELAEAGDVGRFVDGYGAMVMTIWNRFPSVLMQMDDPIIGARDNVCDQFKAWEEQLTAFAQNGQALKEKAEAYFAAGEQDGITSLSRVRDRRALETLCHEYESGIAYLKFAGQELVRSFGAAEYSLKPYLDGDLGELFAKRERDASELAANEGEARRIPINSPPVSP